MIGNFVVKNSLGISLGLDSSKRKLIKPIRIDVKQPYYSHINYSVIAIKSSNQIRQLDGVVMLKCDSRLYVVSGVKETRLKVTVIVEGMLFRGRKDCVIDFITGKVSPRFLKYLAIANSLWSKSIKNMNSKLMWI